MLRLCNTFPNSKYMLWSPKVLWDTWRGVLHVNWVVMGMNNTPLITRTKIINSMVFVDYPKKGMTFLIGFWYGSFIIIVWCLQDHITTTMNSCSSSLFHSCKTKIEQQWPIALLIVVDLILKHHSRTTMSNAHCHYFLLARS